MTGMARPYRYCSWFTVAFGIINTICLTLVISALTFSLKLPLTPFHFPLALGISLGINFFSSRWLSGQGNKWIFLRTTAILLLLIVLSLFMGSSIYDTSYDGQWYHQETIIQLKEGWNPFYTDLPADRDGSLLLNHYSKGAEIPQATLYALLNRIEAGKAINLLLAIASFCLCVFLFANRTGLTKFKVYLLSALFAANPIAITQMFTYYVDGQLASLLCCLVVAAFLLVNDSGRYVLLLFGSIIVITLNIKFTAVVFTGLLILGLLVALAWKRQMNRFRRVFIAAALSTALGLCVVGFNPYVTNTADHGAPFYPLMGESPLDIMTANSPKGFPEKNRFEKLFISLFSHPDNISERHDRLPELKWPFTFHRKDLENSTVYDTRISGFGFLFGEIVCLSALLLVVVLYLNRPRPRRSVGLAYGLGILVFSVLIVSEAWWARYVPQLWFAPLLILRASEPIKRIPTRYLGTLLYVLIAVNSAGVLVYTYRQNLAKTIIIERQMNEFRAAHRMVRVDFGPFRSLRMRLKEHKIDYVEDAVNPAYRFTDFTP